MKILITGANGQLGKTLIDFAPRNFKILKPNRRSLNLADKENCFEYIIKNKPDWIINCAAYTQVDKAETEKDLTLMINAEAPISFANALKIVGGKILQISTDYVFNGKSNTPYMTHSERNPINVYGLSKSLAEEGLEKILFKSDQATILRTSWLISPYKSNFLKKILEFHQYKESMNIIFDQISSPTSTFTLAKTCWQIILNNIESSKKIKHPILHWSDLGTASWYDLAFFIGEVGINSGLLTKKAKVNPITSDQYITAAKRPKFSLLDSRLTRSLLNLSNNHWQSEIIRICNKIKNDKNFQ